MEAMEDLRERIVKFEKLIGEAEARLKKLKEGLEKLRRVEKVVKELDATRDVSDAECLVRLWAIKEDIVQAVKDGFIDMKVERKK